MKTESCEMCSVLALCFLTLWLAVTESIAEESPRQMRVAFSEIANRQIVIIGRLGLPIGSVARVTFSRSSNGRLQICRANDEVVDVDVGTFADIEMDSSVLVYENLSSKQHGCGLETTFHLVKFPIQPFTLDEGDQNIAIDDIVSSKVLVIGRLGLPLGTRCTVLGTFQPHPSSTISEGTGWQFEVKKLNGKAVESPLFFSEMDFIAMSPSRKNLVRPGQSIELEITESGRFRGFSEHINKAIHDENKERIDPQTVPFTLPPRFKFGFYTQLAPPCEASVRKADKSKAEALPVSGKAPG